MTMNILTYFPSPPRGVWYLGPVPIRAYALCIIVGIVVALLIGDRRWQARGGERGVIYDIALWAVPFGLVGGRLYHLLTDWRAYFGEGGIGWEATLRIWDGGLGIWGAVALGGVGAWLGCKRHGIPLPAFGDAIAPGIVLAQAIGRIGNYFNQELYGRETTLPWGLKIFWREDAAGVRDPHLLDGVSTGELYKIVQPTFLYELLWNVLVFLLLIYLDRQFRIGHGRLFAVYVAGYCVGRFGIELLRDDTATHIAGIRINSFTATFVLIGAVVYFVLAPKGREDPAKLGSRWHEADEDDRSAELEPADELVAVGTASGTAAVGDPAPDARNTLSLALGEAPGYTAEPESTEIGLGESGQAEPEGGGLSAGPTEVVEVESNQTDKPEPAGGDGIVDDGVQTDEEPAADDDEVVETAEAAESADGEAAADDGEVEVADELQTDDEDEVDDGVEPESAGHIDETAAEEAPAAAPEEADEASS